MSNAILTRSALEGGKTMPFFSSLLTGFAVWNRLCYVCLACYNKQFRWLERKSKSSSQTFFVPFLSVI